MLQQSYLLSPIVRPVTMEFSGAAMRPRNYIEFFTGAGSWSQLDPLEHLFELSLFHFIIPSLTLF